MRTTASEAKDQIERSHDDLVEVITQWARLHHADPTMDDIEELTTGIEVRLLKGIAEDHDARTAAAQQPDGAADRRCRRKARVMRGIA